MTGHEFVVDYRPAAEAEIPDTCPECGQLIIREEARGSVWPGPADREWAQRYGVEAAVESALVTTIYWRWYCPDDHVGGPVLLG